MKVLNSPILVTIKKKKKSKMVLLYKNLFIKFRSDILSRSAFIVN